MQFADRVIVIYRVTDVSRTICINNFEYFGIFMYSKIKDEVSCAPCTHVYMLLIISLVSTIIFSFVMVSVCVAFIFYLIITKFTLYPLLDYTLYRIVPVYLLQTYKHTSVDAPYTYISRD